MNKLTVMVACCAMAGSLLGEESLVSNIYERVRLVYGNDTRNAPMDVFYSVRGGDGFDYGSVREPFRELIPVVSNNCGKILQDWDAYAANEVVSWTVLNAVCHSGVSLYLMSADSIVSRYELSGTSNDWKSVRFLFAPYRTPQELTMTLMCEDVSVRSLLGRIRECAFRRGDSNVVERCETRLSGEAKKHYLELKAAGAIE